MDPGVAGQGGVEGRRLTETNVADLLRRPAQDRPEDTALVDPGEPNPRRLTWAELDDQVDRVAGGLTGIGLLAGQRLGLLGDNSAAYVIAYLAALRAGLVVVPLHPGAADADLAARLQECGVGQVLAEAQGRDLGSVSARALSENGLAELSGSAHSPVATPPDPEALAVLMTTAGTSGPPRSVMLSHRALIAHLAAVSAYGITDRTTTLLAAVPFSHVFGLNTNIGGWLVSGGRLVLASRGPAGALLDLIAAEQVTTLPVTPRLLFELTSEPNYAERLTSVRTVLSAAAPLPWRLSQDFTAATGLRVEQGYGLTEAGPGVSATVGHEILGPAHVGRALPGVEVRIGGSGDAEAIERATDPGEPGPILVRGANLFSGYWPDGSGGPDADGWFDTGDIGYLAGSDLFLIDRARELVVVSGFTVFPTEVEQAIRELPGVRGVAVVGVSTDAGDAGGRLVAFVAGAVTGDEVRDFCAGRLAPFKRPAEVRIVEDLPRGITGKVRRADLRRRARHGGEAS